MKKIKDKIIDKLNDFFEIDIYGYIERRKKKSLDFSQTCSNFNPSYIGGRKDILKLVPKTASKVLDVGCSTGVGLQEGRGKHLWNWLLLRYFWIYIKQLSEVDSERNFACDRVK